MPEEGEKPNEMAATAGPLRELRLYKISVCHASKQFHQVCQEHEAIPADVLIDIYFEVAAEGDMEMLKDELSQLHVFMKLINVLPLRDKLHRLFKNIVNRDVKDSVFSALFLNRMDTGTPCYRELVLNLLPARLAARFEERVLSEAKAQANLDMNLIKMGMELGDFLCEAGWYEDGSKVLTQCMYLYLAEDQLDSYKASIQCMEKLLGAQIYYSMYSQARMTYETATVIIKKLQDASIDVNLAGMYSAFSGIFYMKCNYQEALDWSVKALEELLKYQSQGHYSPYNSNDVKNAITIFRHSSRSCVIKREFHKAELLIKEAVYLSRDVYGSKSVIYADALLDYAFYLLNRDSVEQAVAVYKECLQIRKAAYGRYNLKTAIVVEDMAYALYVKEYSHGNFDEARALAHKSISVMEVLLQPNHLQLASARRVKALVLEEIAIDSQGSPMEKLLLNEAETLHYQALKVSKQAFGETNVQIAKHYGNLGRLYQSMHKYSEAESMHLKAIAIKEKLLGMFDFEVALSLGHLASLYNYDMALHTQAEELHLRSISIGKRLFGDAYSGLEYDYRGLLQIYTLSGNQERLTEYNRMFSQWKMLRDLKAARGVGRAISDSQYSQPLHKVINDFFSMQWNNLNETDTAAADSNASSSSSA